MPASKNDRDRSESPSVCLVTEIFPPQAGGSGRWLYEVYRRLGIDRRVVTDQLSDANSSWEDPDFIRRVPFDLANTGGISPGGWRDYRRLLGRVIGCTTETPTLVQVARVVPEGWLAWLWSWSGGPPYDCFAHGEEINLAGADGGGVMSSRQHRWMARLVLRGARRVIANSHNTAGMLRDQWRVPEEKITVVHPGVDASFFQPAPPDPDLRRQLDWGAGPVILTVGRLQLRKGHDRVIEALPALRAQFPHLVYAIAGDGEEWERLERLADQIGVADAIRWHRRCDDTVLRQLYQQCDLFIMANRQVGADVEGFGMVFLEAAACGKPTIAGRSGGTREAIQETVTGLLVDGDSADDIATVVATLLIDTERMSRFGEAGRKRVENEFDWPILAGKIESIIASAF